MNYLKKFREKLKRYNGSLVSVKTIRKIEKNAKEYLNKLSKTGRIERICWGWYFIGNSNKIKDFLEFAKTDKNFKIIVGQTAASFWNCDFIHRNVYKIVVSDNSYKRALEKFAKKKNWLIEIEFLENAKNLICYKKTVSLNIEIPEEVITECIQNLAFADAFSILLEQKVNWFSLIENSYWKRISGSNIRVRQVIEYGCSILNKKLNKKLFKTKKVRIKNKFIETEINDAIERVIEFA